MQERVYSILKKTKSYFSNEMYIYILNSKKNNEKKNKKIFFIHLLLNYILFFIHLYKRRKIENKEICFARVKIEKEKIKKLNLDIEIISDDVKQKDFTIYTIGKRIKRLVFINTKYWIESIETYKELKEILKNKELEIYKEQLWNHFVKRIPHMIIFKFSVDEILNNNNKTNIYIGSMYERFSLIIEEIAKKTNKKIICVPHGIENMNKLPKGFVGDKIYCSSDNIKNKLNKIYDTNRFIYEYEINKKLYTYKLTDNKKNIKKKVVYFTQPRLIKENKALIRVLAEYLHKKNKILYIKVHPNEEEKNYVGKNIKFIKNMNEAINDSCCISFYSTILIEAIYNESQSITNAYLLNKNIELKNNLEFLKDKKILKPQNNEELFIQIEKYFESKEGD